MNEYRYQFAATVCVSVRAETAEEAESLIREWHKEARPNPVQRNDPQYFTEDELNDGPAYDQCTYLDDEAEPELIDQTDNIDAEAA